MAESHYEPNKKNYIMAWEDACGVLSLRIPKTDSNSLCSRLLHGQKALCSASAWDRVYEHIQATELPECYGVKKERGQL